MNKLTMPAIKMPKFKLPKCSIKGTNCKSCGLTIVCSVVSYLFILSLIPLMTCRNNSFIQFHAKQGLALLIVWVLFSFSFYLPILPFVFAVLILSWMIIGIINAITGKERRLPLIGNWVK